ncbi:unnamed protein product, partial [Adineta steineri]
MGHFTKAVNSSQLKQKRICTVHNCDEEVEMDDLCSQHFQQVNQQLASSYIPVDDVKLSKKDDSNFKEKEALNQKAIHNYQSEKQELSKKTNATFGSNQETLLTSHDNISSIDKTKILSSSESDFPSMSRTKRITSTASSNSSTQKVKISETLSNDISSPDRAKTPQFPYNDTLSAKRMKTSDSISSTASSIDKTNSSTSFITVTPS